MARTAFGLAIVFAGLGFLAQRAPEHAMAEAARAFLATLDAGQQARATFPFSSEERFNWHFIPRERKGLSLKDMTAPQRDAAVALLKTGLSTQGFTKAETIRSFENILRAMENGRIVRDPELYFVTIFGQPGDAEWGWRYEGHHLAQNWTIVGGRPVATSPAFFGANPAVVREGPRAGERPLAAEEDLARAFLETLAPDERARAIVSPEAPNDIITAASRRAQRFDDAGLLGSALTATQQRALMALIEAHANAQAPSLAALRLGKVKADGMSQIRFSWRGSTTRGERHYYLIQGASFLIEYDNTQNNANHQHIAWRDFNGDFGVDLLRLHYDVHHAAAPTR
jgi:hypothetical protein